MNIKTVMENLLKELKQPENRRMGHTTNAVQFASKIKARYITHNSEFGKSLEGIPVQALSRFEKPVLGYRSPVVLDHHAVEVIFEQAIFKIEKMEEYTLDTEKELNEIKQKLKNVTEELREIKEQSEWALNTLRDKLKFGLNEEQAVYRRERRCKGVLLDTVNKLKKILEAK